MIGRDDSSRGLWWGCGWDVVGDLAVDVWIVRCEVSLMG